MISNSLPNSALESPFACPGCRSMLSFERSLECSGCGRRYLDADGVACFNDSGLYHGPILAKPEMNEFLALAREKGYRYAIFQHLAEKDPELAGYISAPARTAGLELLGLQGHERVLDFGCAFGVLSLELAKRAALVAALDVTREKIEFLEIVKHQDDLKALFPVCNGDPLRLPFADGFFDWVILNAVFEYLPQSIPVVDVRKAHLLALSEVQRVLRAGGHLYLSTKNRYSYLLMLGHTDHHGLRFTSLLPRRIANWVSMKIRQKPYRTITHSFREYQALLHEAGFTSSTVHWPLPNLWRPERFVPLTGPRRETLAALSEVKAPATVRGRVWRLVTQAGLLAQIVPNYTIVARK